MKLITVIGSNDYKPVQYRFETDISEPSLYVAKAIYDIFKPSEVYVLMTDEARNKHRSGLKEVIEFNEIPIKTGKNEQEFWEMFQAVVDKVSEDDEIIIDVTHGFRSQPMLLLSIAVFLQVTKNVKVKHILYGAYEAKDGEGIAPIFNLKPFLDLISWSFATDYFLKKGDGALLSKLIIDTHNQAYIEKYFYQPKNLKGVGTHLEHLTKALSVVRTGEITEYSKKLLEKIRSSTDDAHNLVEAKPIKLLLDKINDRFSKLTAEDSPDSKVRAHAEIVKFYLETKLYQQAVTLARELLISSLCVRCGYDYNDTEKRAEIEKSLVDNESTAHVEIPTKYGEYKDLYRDIGNFRNDVNHAGMRKQPKPAKSLIENIEENCYKAIDLVLQHHLE